MVPRQCEAVRIVRQAGQGFATFAGFAWVILRMCVDAVTCDGREPEALIVTTVITVTFAWSVIVVMVVTITRIVMFAERDLCPGERGPSWR